MGRRQRRFIDRRNAQTFRLVYQDADVDAENGKERVLVKEEQLQSALPNLSDPAAASSTQVLRTLTRAPSPDGAPLNCEKPFATEELTEEQKEEIRELGLPSDGYNYLKHLRVASSRRAGLPLPEALRGGGIFVPSRSFLPPEAEIRYIRAQRLIVRKSAVDEQEAEDILHRSSTTAFSRVVPSVTGTSAQEVQDVEDLLQEFEGRPGGEGDLLDWFVLDATQAEGGDRLGTAAQIRQGAKWLALPEDWSSGEEGGEHEEALPAKSVGRSRFSRGGAGSCGSFSERWKGTDPSDFEGRKERTRPLEIIDEKFENVLDEYDEEDLGELDDEVEDGLSLEQLAALLRRRPEVPANRFQPEGDTAVEAKKQLPKKIGAYKLMKPKQRTAALKAKDCKALEATKTLVQSNEQGSKREEWEDILISVRSDRELDCESVWSCRTPSTLHQPSLITSATKSRPTAGVLKTGSVKLSAKSGIPIEEAEVISEGESVWTTEAAVPVRVRGESAEERRQRKQAVKAANREARLRKKQTKVLYTKESVKQQKQMAGMMTKNASTIVL